MKKVIATSISVRVFSMWYAENVNKNDAINAIFLLNISFVKKYSATIVSDPNITDINLLLSRVIPNILYPKSVRYIHTGLSVISCNSPEFIIPIECTPYTISSGDPPIIKANINLIIIPTIKSKTKYFVLFLEKMKSNVLLSISFFILVCGVLLLILEVNHKNLL